MNYDVKQLIQYRKKKQVFKAGYLFMKLLSHMVTAIKKYIVSSLFFFLYKNVVTGAHQHTGLTGKACSLSCTDFCFCFTSALLSVDSWRRYFKGMVLWNPPPKTQRLTPFLYFAKDHRSASTCLGSDVHSHFCTRVTFSNEQQKPPFILNSTVNLL